MSAAGARGPVAELGRSAALLAVVLGATAGALTLADAVPEWIVGEDRGVHVATDLQDAERQLRARLVLPAYFPEVLVWPAERIRVLPGDPPAVVLAFHGSDGPGTRFVLAQSLGRGPIPERLLPAAPPIDEARIAVGKTPGRLRRIVGPDGSIWRELEWEHAGRTVVARSRGGVEELLRMARSARVQP